MSVRNYLLLFFFIGLGLPDSSNAQQILTFSETDSVEVGDIFELTIIVDGHDQLLSYPSEDDFEPDVELLDRSRYQTGASRDSLVYKLQFFGTEDLTISRKAITLSTEQGDTTLYSNPVPLFFRTVLSEDDEEFRPLKPIFEFARAIYPWVLGVLILLILGYLAYRYWLKVQSSKKIEPITYQPEPFYNPLEQLHKDLENLPKASSLSGFDDFEKYYVELGDAIRRYIKSVHGVPAMEMTTSEITMSLKKEFTSPEVIAVTQKVLNSADMVKFAHFEPTPQMAEKTFEKAKDFLSIASRSDSEIIEKMRVEHERREEKRISKPEETEL